MSERAGTVVAEERVCWFCFRRYLYVAEQDEGYKCSCGCALEAHGWTPTEFFNLYRRRPAVSVDGPEGGDTTTRAESSQKGT